MYSYVIFDYEMIMKKIKQFCFKTLDFYIVKVMKVTKEISFRLLIIFDDLCGFILVKNKLITPVFFSFAIQKYL